MTNVLTVDNSGNVTASGDDAAANLSGTNTGDQSDATLNFSDITTNNSSTSQHGFLKKLDNNSAHYMDGTGAWSTPSGVGTVTSVTFTGDGTVLSSTPSSAVTSSGTVTASLASAGAGTVLGNNGSSSAAPAYTVAPVLGKNATTAGTLGLANGGASGTTITVQNLGATTAYNFNLPATAGSSGAPLVSGGGSSTSMSWGTVTGSGNFAMSASPTFTGTITAAAINASAAVVAGVSSLSIVSSAIATNAALGNYFYVQLASGSTTMSAPSNAADGQIITYELEQPSSGSSGTVSWNAAFDFGVLSAPTLSTTNGEYDIVGFRYSARKSAWLYLGAQFGF
jgi:hypothetical protein